ncbi:MAG: hypothetical protein GQ529_07865 [Methyloprofundus sp.]|nr:hypothetical protein [Methyloprofundus sp.]
MKNSFFLIIPEQREHSVSLKLYEEVALQQWIDDLPVANVSLATRLLHDFIEQGNKLVMSPRKRMAYLELIRANYLVMEDEMRSRLMASGFPKSEMEHKTYSILVSMERELAIAYWIIVKSQTHRQLGWFQSKEAALAIQRLIKCLSSIVVGQYIMNLPIQEWVWIDLHSLYKLGLKIKKESTKVADESCVIHRSSSIQDSYKQIILLSLAVPSGLMPREILQVYKFTELISSLISFEPNVVVESDRKCIIFQDEDKSAEFYAKNKKILDEATLYIDFGKLYKALLKKEKFKNDIDGRYITTDLSPKEDKLPIDLLSYLESRWHGVPLEGAKIFIDRLSRHFVLGLGSTYALQNTYDVGAMEEVSEYLAESASEVALATEFEQSGVLSIGSLISFRKATQPEHKRSLGVVKKISILKGSKKLQFEIELLTGQAHTVMFSQLGKRKKTEKQKALIYNVKKSGEEDVSFLIVDSFMLKEYDLARLYLNEKNFPILLREKRNIGIGYWQFDCRMIDEQELATMSDKG